jgi:hypothetical protein
MVAILPDRTLTISCFRRVKLHRRGLILNDSNRHGYVQQLSECVENQGF